jgi:hypothetical protein
MPNWCFNELSVRGRRDDVREFLSMLDNMKDDSGFFQAIYPMPEELRGIASPTRIVSEEEHQQYLDGKIKTFGGIPITARMQQELRRRFGADNWYDWAVNNWGTKWDVHKNELYRTDWKNGSGVTLTFATAWGPPLKVIEKLSSKFPKLRFSINFNEPGMGCRGVQTYGPHD